MSILLEYNVATYVLLRDFSTIIRRCLWNSFVQIWQLSSLIIELFDAIGLQLVALPKGH